METVTEASEININELVELGAVDNEVFCRTFFPKTARQESPQMHKRIWESLDTPTHRFCNYQLPRGFAKTTTLRMFTAKRAAYGVSRTCLYIGASEGHAVRSVNWLRTQVNKNTFFASTFGLKPGRKWQEDEIEIICEAAGTVCWVKAAGILSNVRGINFDDYRPDLIVLDDVITDENGATLEQREKIANLVFGALKDSLTPVTEDPNAKMAILQTPIHGDDVSCQAIKDPQFHSEVHGCWTPETMDLPLEQQISAWEERYPTEVLRNDKLAAIQRNRLSIFTREMECRISNAENTAFKPHWLKHYDSPPPIGQGVRMIGIDPVPPPTQTALDKGLVNKSFEAICVVEREKSEYRICEYALSRGHDPMWTLAKTFELAMRHQVRAIVVETVAYQKVLQFLLEREMKRRGQYFPLIAFNDKRNKFNRIVSTLSGPGMHGHLWCSPSHVEFIQLFQEYPCHNPDLLDAACMAMSELSKSESATGYVDIDESDIPDLPLLQRCP